jgi:hypothetical protein
VVIVIAIAVCSFRGGPATSYTLTMPKNRRVGITRVGEIGLSRMGDSGARRGRPGMDAWYSSLLLLLGRQARYS